MRLPQQLDTEIKRRIRGLVRSRGWELVPLEQEFRALQARFLRSSGLLFDVGANTGQYVEQSRALGFGGLAVSFEPMAAAYETLASKTAHDPRWISRKLALGAQAGEVSLNISGNSGSSSTLPMTTTHEQAAPGSGYVSSELVVVTTLDEALASLPGLPDGPRFLKLDVQGLEHEVIRGATATLSSVDYLQTELSVAALYDGQADYLSLLADLRAAGLHLVHAEAGFTDSRTGRLLQFDVLLAR